MTRLIIPRGRLYGGKFGCLDSLLTRGRFIWRDIFAGLSIKSSQRSVAANSGKSSFRNYVYSLMTWQLILGSQPCHPRIICSRNDMAANSGTTVILGLAATESLLRTLFVFACFSSTATKLKLAGACFWCLCVDDALRVRRFASAEWTTMTTKDKSNAKGWKQAACNHTRQRIGRELHTISNASTTSIFLSRLA